MKDPILRFDTSVERIPECGCWIWIGWTNDDGYGRLVVNHRRVLAHRFSYQTFVGQIPVGMCVLHRCDVPCCVNPNHLFLGTQLDNIQDRHRKNRTDRFKKSGERNSSRKLNAIQVKAIRAMEGSVADRARAFGISHSQALRIVRNHSWKNYGLDT